jgi:hypothetical protein
MGRLGRKIAVLSPKMSAQQVVHEALHPLEQIPIASGSKVGQANSPITDGITSKMRPRACQSLWYLGPGVQRSDCRKRIFRYIYKRIRYVRSLIWYVGHTGTSVLSYLYY